MPGYQIVPEDPKTHTPSPTGVMPNIAEELQQASHGGVHAPGVQPYQPGGNSANMSAQQQAEAIINGLTYKEIMNPSPQTIQQLSQLIGSLPGSEATAILNKLPSNSPIASQISQTFQPKPSNVTNPLYDPLALQTMWSSVFGPAFDQASKLSGNAGNNYLAAMQNVISGSNESPQAKAQQANQAKATAALLGGYGKNQAQQVPAGLSFDSLLNALQQATGTAQLAQGAAEKAVAYGTNLNAAQAFQNPTGTATVNSANSGALGPVESAALLNSALSGSQTSSPYASTGLIP